MSAPETHYDILGVPSDASEQDIVYAYRTLIRKNHPDIAGEQGAEITAKINHAFDVLRDPVSRRDYDRKIGAECGVREPSPGQAPAPSSTPSPRRPARPPVPPRTFRQRNFPPGSWLKIATAIGAVAAAWGLLNLMMWVRTLAHSNQTVEVWSKDSDIVVAFFTGCALLVWIVFGRLFPKFALYCFAVPLLFLVIGLFRSDITWAGIGFTAVIVALLASSRALLLSWRTAVRYTEGAILFDELYDTVQAYGRGPFFVKATEADTAIVEDPEGRLHQIKGWGRARVDTWVVLNDDDLIVHVAPWYVHKASDWRHARADKAAAK
ncbi:J domain-containing protein [Agromyces humi]|uniref:J domain-containing protein n=1 Tax=Agromyces humi TaxID=1766800 RepID=UPI001358E6A2|nr:J domain-containing protein [Agromyces humi]